ncbi:hypothetical protein CHELA1G11_13029 [Hyphomicrobiales bacterium]|nr:hypothetical protein CHELA1G2_11281 [Hyphomicrobiales bacterium]CAH1668808.1 hypothetical protein CHELA1G11_13029 [Hyphomicrobiales bacterium]
MLDYKQSRAIAVHVLGLMARDKEALTRFFNVTGASPETISACAQSPGFFEAVLDFSVADAAFLKHIEVQLRLPASAIDSARACFKAESEADTRVVSISGWADRQDPPRKSRKAALPSLPPRALYARA